MGDCRKRNILQTDFEGEKACKDFPENTNVLHWKKYFSWRIMLKKNFTGEKFFNSRGLKKNSSQTKSPIPRRKTQMVNSLRGGGRKRLDTSENVIHQQNGWQNGIAIRFLIHYFPFKNFAVFCCFSIIRALDSTEYRLNEVYCVCFQLFVYSLFLLKSMLIPSKARRRRYLALRGL